MTTDTTHELDNLSKCLAAGFDYAILVSSDKRVLRQAEKAMEAERGSPHDRLRFCTPDSIVALLTELSAQAKGHSTTIKGYKVKVKYRALGDEEALARQSLLADVIAEGLKRNKRK